MVLLVLALLGAGCLDAPRAQPGASDAQVLAYVDAAEESGPNRTILAVHADGAAIRLTYLADGSWLPRVAPGIDVDRDLVALLFEPTSERERGGVVLRVERGEVTADALAALQPYLEGEWPEPFAPPDAPHPWYRPATYVRVDPRDATEAPPDGKQHLGPEHATLAALIDAFDSVSSSFRAASVQHADLPFQKPWDGCLRVRTTATPAAVRVGEVVEVRAEVTNCGASDVLVDHQACTESPVASVQMSASHGPMLAVLPATETPAAAYTLDLVCRGDAPATRIAPGGVAVLTRRWNGTIVTCGLDGACEHRAAPSGPYSFTTFASGQMETLPAGVTVIARDAETTRMLLARERDWVNTTSDQPIEGFFGPHCAPAHYTTEPATLTLWHYGEKPALAPAVVVRDWRGGERPSHVATMSADRLDLVPMPNGTVALSSPFDRGVALASVTLDDDAFVVDGTRLEPGDTHHVRVLRTFERAGGTYETTSDITLENVGEAAVLWAQAGGCA